MLEETLADDSLEGDVAVPAEIDFEHGYRVNRRLHTKVKHEMIAAQYKVSVGTVDDVVSALGVEAAMVYLNGMSKTVQGDALYAEHTYNEAVCPPTNSKRHHRKTP